MIYSMKFLFSAILLIVSNLLCSAQTDIVSSANLSFYPFDIKDFSPNSMPYLDSVAGRYNHFIAAEYHGQSSALQLQKKMISYLSVSRGLNKIVLESSYAEGFWLNKYLDSGDTSLLREVTDRYTLRYSHVGVKEEKLYNYYEYYKWLYHFLREHEIQIEIVGIDITQFDWKTEVWAIQKFFDEYNLSSDFEISDQGLLNLQSQKKVGLKNMRNWLVGFYKELDPKSSIVRNKLGADWVRFERFLTNLADATPKNGLARKLGYRDSIMYKNFVNYISPNDVAYSQFGHAHIPLKVGDRQIKSQRRTDVFVTLLEQDSLFKGRTMAFNLLCFQCFKVYSYLLTEEESEALAEATGNKPTLIDFRFATNELEDFSDYFQYTIFIYER